MRIRDITPASFSCHGGGCPAIYETDRGTCLIIGSKIDSPDNLLPGRVGTGETVVEVPMELIQKIIFDKGEKP